MSEKSNKRPHWGREADNTFIDIWEKRAADLRGDRKKCAIYEEMALEMQAAGYKVRGCDVKYKIHNYQVRHRTVETNDNDSDRRKWRLYPRIHRIISGDKLSMKESFALENMETKMYILVKSICKLSKQLNESEQKRKEQTEQLIEQTKRIADFFDKIYEKLN